MKLTINGCINSTKKKILGQAAGYFLLLLIGKKLSRKVDLRITVLKKLDEDVEGFCYYPENNQPIYYVELLYNRSTGTMLHKLAHELVHVKQFITGELKYEGRNTAIWGGDRFNLKKIDYWDQPWEIEAFGREIGLVARFNIKNNTSY